MKYLYFKIYKILTKIKINKTPAFSALMIFITLQGANILSIYTLIKFYYKIKIDKEYTVLEALVVFIVLFITNYFLLYNKRNKIIKRYINENKEDRIWGTVLLLLYIVFTFAILFLIVKIINP